MSALGQVAQWQRALGASAPRRCHLWRGIFADIGDPERLDRVAILSALRERRDLARELYEAQPLCWGEELLDLHELPSEVATLAVEVWLDSVAPRPLLKEV